MQFPHDKLFKETFSDLEVTTDFMQQYLPEDVLELVELETLEVSKDSFIQDDLKDYYVDLLFQIELDGREGFVYFLFEHKSYPAEDIALQLLQYMLEIWKKLVHKDKVKQLPVIVPILFYHGRVESYDVKTIGEWMNVNKSSRAKVSRFIPNFDVLFYNLSLSAEEEIRGGPKLQAYLQISKYIFAKDIALLIDKIVLIERLLHEANPGYFNTLLIYLLSTHEDLPLEKLAQRMTKEGRKRIMTIAEKLRREGREEGREEEKVAIVKQLLRLHVERKKIMKASGLSVSEIEEIERELHKESDN